MHTQPSYEGILDAARAIAEHLPPTPVRQYPMLDVAVGCRVLVKHENVQPTGAFKVRGGLNLAAQLDPDCPGLVTASTGNHAQSIAYAARLRGITAVIVMPASAPAVKVDAVGALGADVVIHGSTMTESAAHAQELAATGLRYIDPGQEPAIINGHGTVSLELLQHHPDLEAIYVRREWHRRDRGMPRA